MGWKTIFSTHVGMNRMKADLPRAGEYILHACGDEPIAGNNAYMRPYIFSTHVGMNRWNKVRKSQKCHILHACGDEPP